MTAGWNEAVPLDRLEAEGRAVVRLGGKQIALFVTPEGIKACNNRCPHEGYPLREGSLDDCILTCNWHNWKFDLTDGSNLLGGDRLRTYPVEVRDGQVWVEIVDPPEETRRAEIMDSLADAFQDNDYARMARELARFARLSGDPLDTVRQAVLWSFDRMEFGTTHAYAASADWLTLYEAHTGDAETQLICLLESIGHMADDVLREQRYPFAEETAPYDEDSFVAAVEREDEAAAVAMVRGSFESGLRYPDLERGLGRAALAHYNDFGHSLIYVLKTGQLIDRLGDAAAMPLTLALTRSLVYASREDQIPEFRRYASALEAWRGEGNGAEPSAEGLRGQNIRHALETVVGWSGAPAADLYRALLNANAWNLLHYDDSYQTRADLPLKDNIGWLDFTHGITFANAVRRLCGKYPELWPAGLLQMACFVGRNAPYTDASLDVDDWRVDDHDGFFAAAVDRLFDHGQGEFIISAHLIKTALAAREECEAGMSDGGMVTAGLYRFLNSPLKRRHARRTMRQAIDFVSLDG